MRLIDADKLKQDTLDLPNCYNGFSDTYDKACIIGVIDEQPTIDAVEVVICKKCKHYMPTTPYALCEALDCMATDSNNFCSLGERRTDE